MRRSPTTALRAAAPFSENLTTSACCSDYVRAEALAIINVVNLDVLEFSDSGSFQEKLIDTARALIVKICLSDPNPVQFRLKHRPGHRILHKTGSVAAHLRLLVTSKRATREMFDFGETRWEEKIV
jgi:hypothetical protein